MRLAVFSHKPCWSSDSSPTGFATDGGFPAQMRGLAELFDATVLLVPCARAAGRTGQTLLSGPGLRVAPLTPLRASGWARKALFPFWLARNAARILRELLRADAVHAAVPGDVGTIGMLLALALRKPLLVRYCNNWLVTRTAAERCLKRAMTRFAGGRNVMLATGGTTDPPSANPELRWIFATSLEEREIQASARRRDRLPGNSPRLILVGRQERGKGADALITALAEVAGTFPGVTLEILGDGASRAASEELARGLGVAERVAFRGNVDRGAVLEALRNADLFCFPTSSEGFPKVVIEAMACGLPVLTTRVSVLPLLLSGGGGLLLEQATPVAVAEGIRRCLGDESAYREMSARALETARAYSLERWRDTIGELLSRQWGPLRAAGAPREDSGPAPLAGPSDARKAV